MLKRLLRLFPLVLIVLLAGCDQKPLVAKFVSESEQTLIKGYIDQLRARDFDAIEKSFDKRLADPDPRGTLEKMAALIPAGEPRSVKLVLARKHRQNGVTSLNLVFEYEFPEKWLVIDVVTEERDGTKVIAGFHVYPRTQSLEEENRFSLTGKRPIDYLVLAGMIGAVLISLYALIACVLSKNVVRRKWLWIPFILVGFGQFSVNWTSGAWGINPLLLKLLSAGVFFSAYGPWIPSFSIPLGAILFLFKRHKKAAQCEQSAGETRSE